MSVNIHAEKQISLVSLVKPLEKYEKYHIMSLKAPYYAKLTLSVFSNYSLCLTQSYPGKRKDHPLLLLLQFSESVC